MKKLISFFKRRFAKINPVHNCVFTCSGWGSHFNQVNEIQDGIDNPSWYHYPSIEVMKGWLQQGFDYARVMQSHWNCTCGQRHTFFFLAKPSKGYGNKIPQPDTIPTAMYQEMTTYNPFERGASRGKSITEVTDELIGELCWPKK